IRALASELPRFPFDHRRRLIKDLSIWPYPSFSWGEVVWAQPPEPPETSEAIDELLVQCLEDTGTGQGMSGGIWDGKGLRDARLCDLAAHALSRRWHQPSLFDLEADVSARDRQRRQLQNFWRQRHGLPLLPVPAAE